MRNPILAIAIAFVLAAPSAALADNKNKQRNIEVHDSGFGVSPPAIISRSDGGGATVGRKSGLYNTTSQSGKGDTHPSPLRPGWDLKANKER